MAAASARDRCTMPPCRCLSRSLVAVAAELVHRWDTPLVNFAVARSWKARGAQEHDATNVITGRAHELELTGTLLRREPSMPPQDDTQ